MNRRNRARLVGATVLALIGLAIPATSAFGATPPGQKGYEGQPGNQGGGGGGGGHAPGLLGYEGQPGNQGG
jgi:hypothetical protein